MMDAMIDDIDEEHDVAAENGIATMDNVILKQKDTNSDIIMAEETLIALEALLTHTFTHEHAHKNVASLKTDFLFQMAGCPFDDFVQIYIRDREAALKAGHHERRE